MKITRIIKKLTVYKIIFFNTVSLNNEAKNRFEFANNLKILIYV